jgi:hypothetical protein
VAGTPASVPRASDIWVMQSITRCAIKIAIGREHHPYIEHCA